MKYPHIVSRIIDRPLLIDPRKLNVILAAIGPRLDADIDWGMAVQVSQAKRSESGFMVLDGVAVIPVMGSLIHRGDWMDAMSGMTSYRRLDLQLAEALADPNVRSILLEIDSPGGEVAGVFDLADQIYGARGEKPIYAIASDLSASAAYLIASAADKVFTTRTAELGSIGVVTAHVDMSKAADKQGVAVTYIYAGDHKVDGNPFQPLPAGVKARIQGDIDKVYDLFVSTVARNRNLSAEAVRKTQALTYMGADAVTVGLADEIGTYESVFAELSATPGALARRPNRKEAAMPKEVELEREATTTAPKKEPAASAIDIAKACAEAGMPSAAIAELIAQAPTAEQLATKVEAFKAKQTAETERAGAIKDACAAAHQEDMAQTFIDAGMDITGVRAVLGKLTEHGSEIDSRQPAAPVRKGLDVHAIYQRFNAAKG